MPEDTRATTLKVGRIPRADRIQRLVIGGALMLLTVSGFAQHLDWRGILALILQTELLLTGMVGWCPVYWTCRIPVTEARSIGHSPN